MGVCSTCRQPSRLHRESFILKDKFSGGKKRSNPRGAFMGPGSFVSRISSSLTLTSKPNIVRAQININIDTGCSSVPDPHTRLARRELRVLDRGSKMRAPEGHGGTLRCSESTQTDDGLAFVVACVVGSTEGARLQRREFVSSRFP